MKGLRRYPEYRASGVEWLGEIPAHWGFVELKRLAPARPADAVTGRHNGSVWQLDLEHIAADTGRVRTKHRAPISEIGSSTAWFDESNVLYSKLRPYLNKVVLPDEPGIATSELIPLSPNPDAVNRSFLAYYLLSPGFVAYASRHVSGTKMPRVIPTFFWSHTVPLPPLAEQRAIADFLDDQTSLIDRLVRKNERLIDLLNEKRASLISHAVTRGLDPDVPMRDSGVAWLGEIPALWGMRPTESFASYDKQAVDPATLDTADKVFHYSIPSIQETGDGTVEPPSQIGSTKSLITGSLLLVSRLNPRKGVVVLATEKSIPTLCSTEFVPLRMNECHDERWAFYEFLSEPIRQRLSGMVQSATRSHQRVDVGHILKVDHPIPPRPEQRAIARFLDHQTARIDALVAKTRAAIERLREYRRSVVSAAVTGQIDVREPPPPP